MSRIFRPYKSFPTQKYYKTLPEKEWFGQPNGVATLDENGKLVSSQIPGGITPGGDSHNKGWFATPDSLPTTAEDGDYAIVGSTDTIWVWDSDTSSWVNSGAKGQVATVNNQSPDTNGNVNLDATLIPSNIVGLGDNVEASIAIVNNHTVQNGQSIVNLENKVKWFTTPHDYKSNIEGELNISSHNAQNPAKITIDGVDINTIYQKAFTVGDGLTLSDENVLASKLLTVDNKSPINGNIDISASDVDAYTIEQVDVKLATKQDKLKAGDGISISDDNTISATGATAGTVLSVNNIGPTENGNVELNISDIPTLDTELNSLKSKVANISTQDSVTTVSGTLEVVGKSDTDIPTVDTGEKGQVLTNTIVVSDEIDTAKIAMSGNNAVKIESFDTSISDLSTDTGLPTSKAVYDAISKNGVLSDASKLELSTDTNTGLLLMPNGENYVKPEIGQFVDYKIKLFAKSIDNTKFEKYSVNFFAINNNDTSIITSSPTCESVSFAGGALIDNVDVRANTEDSTKIEFFVTTTSDNVVLYTSLNKTIINNII